MGYPLAAILILSHENYVFFLISELTMKGQIELKLRLISGYLIKTRWLPIAGILSDVQVSIFPKIFQVLTDICNLSYLGF